MTPPNKTGWPPGLLQDDSKKLTNWFSSRIDARWVVRQVCREIAEKRMTPPPIWPFPTYLGQPYTPAPKPTQPYPSDALL